MRILILTDGIFPFEIGGMQKHAHYMAKYFLKKGVDLTIYHCLVDKDIPADIDQQLRQSLDFKEGQFLSSKCFKFPRLAGLPGHYIRESYLYSKLLYDELIREKPFDFIYIKGFSGWYTLEHKNGLPKMGIQLHGLEMFQPSSSLSDYFGKMLLRGPAKKNLALADYIFSYGGKIKDLLVRLGCQPEKIKEQYGGIDEKFLISEEQIKMPTGKRKFLFIGRNERRKGYQELKSALKELAPRDNFMMTFVGHIEEENKIISDNIRYLGTVRDQDVYYKIIDEHDVLIVPSISEGLPTVILEAMARGLTVIATDVGA
ncbi:MAG: glycosyltransferase family 4 protein, partial [Bacteroidetes bacterium]|nr:glycosyltransferase family 4 protein [Bacteroidota bacterium]